MKEYYNIRLQLMWIALWTKPRKLNISFLLQSKYKQSVQNKGMFDAPHVNFNSCITQMEREEEISGRSGTCHARNIIGIMLQSEDHGNNFTSYVDGVLRR